MGELEYRLLGSVTATRNGEALAIGRRHPRAVMALLLLERGKVVPVEALIEALWAGRAPGQPRTAVQGYVSSLRRALGDPAIETRSGGYVLHAEAEDVDADRFAQLVLGSREALADGDATGAELLLRQALDLWRGPPLADFAYDTWAQEPVRRLLELRLAAVEQLNDLRLANGEHLALLPELEGLVREEPLRERFCEQYMVALARSGRQADALTAYHDLRARLAEEMGIDPSRSLQDVYRQILRQDERVQPVASSVAPDTCLTPDELDADVAFAESWASSLRNFEREAFSAVGARAARLVSAIEYAIETGAKEAAVRLLTATWFYWIIRGAQEEADVWGREILELPAELTPEWEMEGRWAASELARVTGDFQRAVELKLLAQETGEELGLIDVVAGLDADLAHLFVRLGELDVADAHAQHALDLRQSNPNDMCGVGNALVAVGEVREARGDLVDATRAYEEAVADQEAHGFDGEAAYMRARFLGRAHRKRGNTRAAYATYRRALDYAQSVGDYGTSACALQGLAWVAMRRGHQTEAIRLLAEASRPDWQNALDPDERRSFEADVAALRREVDVSAFEAAWRIGAGAEMEAAGIEPASANGPR